MLFEIQVDTGKGRYKMQVERIYAGDSLERFKVSGGGKSIVLQSNRPELLATGGRKPIDWKIKEGQVSSNNIEAATYALYRTMTAIEDYVKAKEPDWITYKQQSKKAMDYT